MIERGGIRALLLGGVGTRELARARLSSQASSSTSNGGEDKIESQSNSKRSKVGGQDQRASSAEEKEPRQRTDLRASRASSDRPTARGNNESSSALGSSPFLSSIFEAAARLNRDPRYAPGGGGVGRASGGRGQGRGRGRPHDVQGNAGRARRDDRPDKDQPPDRGRGSGRAPPVGRTAFTERNKEEQPRAVSRTETAGQKRESEAAMQFEDAETSVSGGGAGDEHASTSPQAENKPQTDADSSSLSDLLTDIGDSFLPDFAQPKRRPRPKRAEREEGDDAGGGDVGESQRRPSREARDERYADSRRAQYEDSFAGGSRDRGRGRGRERFEHRGAPARRPRAEDDVRSGRGGGAPRQINMQSVNAMTSELEQSEQRAKHYEELIANRAYNQQVPLLTEEVLALIPELPEGHWMAQYLRTAVPIIAQNPQLTPKDRAEYIFRMVKVLRDIAEDVEAAEESGSDLQPPSN